jgi:hypothetical protein
VRVGGERKESVPRGCGSASSRDTTEGGRNNSPIGDIVRGEGVGPRATDLGGSSRAGDRRFGMALREDPRLSDDELSVLPSCSCHALPFFLKEIPNEGSIYEVLGSSTTSTRGARTLLGVSAGRRGISS